MGGMGVWCVRYGWIGGRREKVRGVYRFSSLVKQNKKGENCAVFSFAGFFFLKNLCYEVIVEQKIYKRPSNYYSHLSSRCAIQLLLAVAV